MRVAIAGAGNVGTYIANALADTGHDVLMIEDDESVIARLDLPESVTVANVDGCEVSSLRRLGLERFDVMVAATGDDEDNLVMSLLAKSEFAVDRVIARVNHPKNRWMFNEAWGVDISVSTPHLITAFVEEAVSTGTLVRLLQLQGGEARLVEVKLADDSPAIGRQIKDLGVPREATLVAVIREGHVVVPRGDTTFEVADEVLALVTAESEEDVRRILTAD